jgi:hypothetical protein
MEDVDVLTPSPDHDDRSDTYPDKFACQFASGLIAYFRDENDACAFQRMWRTAIGLDPTTGQKV